MIDPYPSDLDEIDKGAVNQPSNPLLAALARLADSLDANTAALRANGSPIQPRPALAPLPPVVQVVGTKPSCTYHGPDKVAPSQKGSGFYCQARAEPGQPANARGYCTWHT